jgi:hypothetical protein
MGESFDPIRPCKLKYKKLLSLKGQTSKERF